MRPRYPVPAGPPLPSSDCRIPIDTGLRDPTAVCSAARAQDFMAYAAGVANVIMQLSWPEVGYGVVESPVESGNVLAHPVKRARTTFTYLAVALGGTDGERQAYARAVSGVHAQVRSTEQSPVSYHALHAELQAWVGACLYVGLEDTHQLLHGRMHPAQRAEFLASAAPLSTTLQVRPADWPATPQAFDHSWATGCRRVSIDPRVRAYLDDLVGLHHQPGWVRAAAGERLRFLSAGFLPPLFREEMHWDWTAEDQARFDRTVRRWAAVNSRLPEPVRFAPARVLMGDLRRRIRRNRPLV